MITYGPKSYYEEYVRKKDSDRALTKPPALLTDRNAYINFLEVQLERVSAACFAVQSYEDRFNDMQGLIVSLDERCNNTTRLISIAQQGTEEVRSEAYKRADIESQVVKSFRADTKKTIDLMNNKVGALERSLSSFPQIEGRLNAMDKRVNEMEANQVNAMLESRIANKALDERINKLDSVKDELFALVESTRAALSRVTFDVEENNARVNNYMASIESRVSASMHANKEDIQRELGALQARCTNQNDELRKQIELRDLEMLNTAKKQYQALGEELDASRRKWSQELDGLTVHLKEDAGRRVDKVQHSLTQAINQLRSSQSEQAGFLCDIEQSFLGQLEGVHTSMKDISQHQQTVEEKVNTTHKSLETKLQELQTTLSSPVRNSSNNWAHNQGTPARSFVAQSHDMSAAAAAGLSMHGNGSDGAGPQSFHHPADQPPSFPMSPVPHNADASFAFPGFAPDPRSMSGMAGAPSGYYYPPPMYALPGSVVQPVYHCAAPPSAAASHHQESQVHLTPHGASLNDSRVRAKSPTAVPGRDSSLRVPQRSTSPSLVSRRSVSGSATRPAGLSQSRLRSASLSPRSTRKVASAEGIEVIQRFMELFKADKEEIAQRLEELGAPVSDKLPRRRGGLRKVKDKSKPKEAPGDLLGNFLLNYRKDRAEIMNRLSSLRASEAAAAEEENDDAEVASDEPPLPVETNQAVDVDGEDSDDVQERTSSKAERAADEQNTSLSRSMDEFVRTFRNRGKERPRTSNARSVSPKQASVSSGGSSASGGHSGFRSPQRLRTGDLLSSVFDSQPPLKRYMQMTESQSIARSQSPNSPGQVDRSALVWEYDHVTLKPLWKKPNTYQSPCRASRDGSTVSSRANSTSPGARTASSLIDRLAKLDKSAAASGKSTAGTVSSSSCSTEPAVVTRGFMVRPSVSQAQVSFAAPVSAGLGDAASVISTSTTSSTSTGQL